VDVVAIGGEQLCLCKVTTYPVTGEPPSDAGAAPEFVVPPKNGTAATDVGSPGFLTFGVLAEAGGPAATATTDATSRSSRDSRSIVPPAGAGPRSRRFRSGPSGVVAGELIPAPPERPKVDLLMPDQIARYVSGALGGAMLLADAFDTLTRVIPEVAAAVSALAATAASSTCPTR
jgi:hypothetical protein